MARDAGNPFLGAYDVRDSHGMVVDDVCEVISRVTVRFEDDEIPQEREVEL